MTDAYKTAKAVDMVNAEQFFHKSCNSRHREHLVKLADQFKTNEGQHCFAQSAVNIWNLLAQTCGDRHDQCIQEGTWQIHRQQVYRYQMKEAGTHSLTSLIQHLWILVEY